MKLLLSFILPLLAVASSSARSRELQSSGSNCQTLSFSIKERRLIIGGNNETIITATTDTEINVGGKKFAATFNALEIGRDGDCVQMITLEQNKNTLVALQSACGQRAMAVIGGTGKFDCATGEAEAEDGGQNMKYTIEVCSSC